MKPIPIPGRKKVHQASAKPKFKERKFVIEWHSNAMGKNDIVTLLSLFFFPKLKTYDKIAVRSLRT